MRPNCAKIFVPLLVAVFFSHHILAMTTEDERFHFYNTKVMPEDIPEGMVTLMSFTAAADSGEVTNSKDLDILRSVDLSQVDYSEVERNFSEVCLQIENLRRIAVKDGRRVAKLFMEIDSAEDRANLDYLRELAGQLTPETSEYLEGLKTEIRNKTTSNRMDWVGLSNELPEYAFDRISFACERFANPETPTEVPGVTGLRKGAASGLPSFSDYPDTPEGKAQFQRDVVDVLQGQKDENK